MKKIVKQILSKEYRHEKILVLVLMVCAGIAFLSFSYGDILCTLDNSVLLVKAIRDGEFLNYYDYTLLYGNTYWPADYDILIYIIFALWNIPIILLHLFFGYDYILSGWSLMWGKGISVVFIIGVAYGVYKICRLLDIDKRMSYIACFLVFSSVSVFAPVFMIAQYDSISLMFMVFGFYFYLKGEYKKFLILFAIAIPLKMFAIFLLVPLILLKEKRIFIALFQIAITCVFGMIPKVLFAGDPVYQFRTGSQNEYALTKLLNSSVSYGSYEVPIFLTLLVAICIYCYVKELKNDKENILYPIYISALVFSSFIAFVSINDYWIVIAVPFIIVLIMCNPEKMKINILLETMAGAMYLLYACIHKYNPYNSADLIKDMMIAHFFETPKEYNVAYGSVMSFLQSINIDQFGQLFHALFVVALICLLVINLPKNIDIGTSAKFDIKVLWTRNLVLLFFIVLFLYANMKTLNPIAITTMDEEKEVIEVNLYDDDILICQELVFEESIELEQLVLPIMNTGYIKDNMASVWVTITVQGTGECLYEERLGGSLMPTGDYVISLPNIAVEEGKIYILSLDGVKGTAGTEYALYVYQGTEQVLELPTVINGEEQDYNLCFSIR